MACAETIFEEPALSADEPQAEPLSFAQTDPDEE